MAAPVILRPPAADRAPWDVGLPANVDPDLFVRWHAARGLLGAFCPWPWRLGWREDMAVAPGPAENKTQVWGR